MNFSGHNLALLVSLNTMLDERNVTHAAEKLHISQPALSAQLARLRELFGDPLLIPAQSGRGMVLTPLAAHLRDPLHRALQTLEDVVRQRPRFDPTVAHRTFSICANDNAAAIIAPRLAQLTRDAGLGGIRYAFRVLNPSILANQLESGEVDLALTSRDAVPGASQELLLEESFRMAQRKKHPRGVEPLSLSDYVKLEHILVSGHGGGFRGFIDDLLAEFGLVRKIGVSVQFYSLVPIILKNSDLVCTLPVRFLDHYKDTLDTFQLPFDANRYSLYATWHARFDQDGGHVWLREQLQSCVNI
ncbi:LysR family regulatory protein [Burkholderia arboris]|uniref:LysR family regulatory protein n=1 Tax=Burkholderia arboris TaxID=488730 RepID=A0A9Q9UV06_9BURK|nr:LysR family transcriptional regulator [Burkholderia arboris]VWC44947.1 LysR family regulatory protein [Burkholderia arboris]